jgi:glycosyltransferase involved in cell wall biosynthesis
MSAPENPASSRTASQGLVSIITPSLNTGSFIRETLKSVAEQDYPLIEHIVVDGGSSDGTLEILQDYPGTIVLTGKDRGAADAINRGFRQSRGEFMMWLNADDVLLPGAISAAVNALHADSRVAGVYGNAWWIDESGKQIGPYPTRQFDPKLLENECFICQPASLLRSEVFESIGMLDPDCDLTFDYELWMRLAHHYSLKHIDVPMAYSRMHDANKTLGQREGVFLETFRVLKHHYDYVPFPWIYGYLCYRTDRRDQFFEPLRPSVLCYLESLPYGLSLNGSMKIRYVSEWRRVMTWAGLRRLMNNL